MKPTLKKYRPLLIFIILMATNLLNLVPTGNEPMWPLVIKIIIISLVFTSVIEFILQKIFKI